MQRVYLIILAVLFGLLSVPGIQAVENEVCLECHEGDEFQYEMFEPDNVGFGYRRAEEREVQDVDPIQFKRSAHSELECTDCHTTATETHDEDEIVIKKVKCQACHEDEYEEYSKTVHGEAMLNRKDRFAPTCYSCHGNHYILPPTDENSSVYFMNIPETCGRCHKEGTEMTETHVIDQANIIENYSMSIHGEAVFRRGLKVAPVCTTCHGEHDIMRHENPLSHINKQNVADTCTQCHAQIERTHKPMVQGHLWEKEPGKLPICVECHMSHNLRQAIYDHTITDEMCIKCHSNPQLKTDKTEPGKSVYMDGTKLNFSVHAKIPCVQCHFDTHPDEDTLCKDLTAFEKYAELQADSGKPVCKSLKPVDCASCHEEEVTAYQNSIHGKLGAKKDADIPKCQFCHGEHDTLSKKDRHSATFPRNVPDLCGQCHKEGERSAIRKTSSQTNILNNYTMSIHGRALEKSGLLVSATCVNCHSTHNILPAKDSQSTVNHKNLPDTCAQCHFGINESFKYSVHSSTVTLTEKALPVCNDCHSSHTIKRHDLSQFRFDIIDKCGKCHQDLMKTYFDTYHGKVSKLGDAATAECSDCHGSHNIFAPVYATSTLHPDNIEETCSKCHPAVNKSFVEYLPHATHNDKEKYPILFYTFWGMTWLLIGTFLFFGIHTMLWFIRLSIEKIRHKKTSSEKPQVESSPEPFVRRFQVIHTVQHLMIIVSFLGLAITGMTLKFSDNAFFAKISSLLGGPLATGYLHRLGAVITFGYVAIHFFHLAKLLISRKMTVKGLFTEEYSMIPLPRDLKELWQNLLYFVGQGPAPKFGRWTYFEKFDYMAVFWGIMIIGSTGLILWFPETATLLIPGWFINVATIIHSDEALLATGFIFTIHFFNTHLRPGKFPMDMAIFTQKIPLSELKEERPREYDDLVKNDELEQIMEEPPSREFFLTARIFGLSFLSIGIIIVIAIIYSLLFV